jgi:hypothetical protein
MTQQIHCRLVQICTFEGCPTLHRPKKLAVRIRHKRCVLGLVFEDLLRLTSITLAILYSLAKLDYFLA